MGRIFRKSGNHSQNNQRDNAQRVNWNAISEVRLIDEHGDMVGIVPTREALRRANDADMDLINISPNSNPPVCKICNYGKFKYEQQKKQKNNRSGGK